MRPSRELALVAVLLASFTTTLVLPALARAEDSELRAKELYRNGERLYEEGLYEDAIVAWEIAYELSKRPLLLYNIANALERIGRWDEALRRINQYRALAPEDERETLDRRMRAIERRLNKKREDDAARRAEDEAKRSAEQDILRAKPGSTTTNNSVTLRSRPQRPKGPPTGAIVLMALGSSGMTAGGFLGGLALEARSEAALLCRGVGEVLFCPESAGSFLTRDASLSLGADIGLVAGGATLGAGIVLSILDSQGLLPGNARRVVLVPSAGPGQASLSLAGTF
jgi:tetratricopeptide (TPR) repeat protein